MNKWEIACVIFGFICFCESVSSYDKEKPFYYHICNIIIATYSLAMVLLPLYFNFWKK